MEEENVDRTEIRRLRRLLREIAELAEHASLTGSLSQGARSAIRRYNQIVTRLERLGIVSAGLFEALPEDASFDELGVDSKLLAGYLEADEEEVERAHHRGPHGGPNIIVGSLNGLQGLEELKDLGRTIRESLPDWLRERVAAREAERSAPPTPPAPPAPPEREPDTAPIPMPGFPSRG